MVAVVEFTFRGRSVAGDSIKTCVCGRAGRVFACCWMTYGMKSNYNSVWLLLVV